MLADLWGCNAHRSKCQINWYFNLTIAHTKRLHMSTLSEDQKVISFFLWPLKGMYKISLKMLKYLSMEAGQHHHTAMTAKTISVSQQHQYNCHVWSKKKKGHWHFSKLEHSSSFQDNTHSLQDKLVV